MPKLKLHVELDYDFFLFGICCPEKPYRLCWALNNKLNVTFKKTDDRVLHEKKQKVILKFPIFFFRDEELFTDYRVIVNKAENKNLIPEYKQADYLLMIQGGNLSLEKQNLLRKLREIPFIQTAFDINPQNLKSKENLLF